MTLNQIGDVFRGSIVGSGAPTPFDLPNIGDLNREEVEKYIRKKIRDNLDDPKTFEKLTRVYEKALKYLEEELFYTHQELGRLKKQKFSCIGDLIDFLIQTTSKSGRMNCVVAKIFQSFYDCDEEFNDRVKEVKNKTQGVIDGKLIKPLRILQSNENELLGEEYFESNNTVVRKIPYKIKKRIKSIESTVSKEVRDPTYFTIERTSDMHGLTFEVENKGDILPLMQMVAGYVFKKGEYEVKNDKGMFSFEEIENSSEIDEDFKARVAIGTKQRDKPESGDVVDIKLLTAKNKQKGTENMNIEIKFTVVKNQNEKGLNMHGVYNYAKKLQERIRLEGFVAHEYIERITDKFLQNLPELLYTNVGRSEKEGDDVYPYKRELFNALKQQNHLDSGLALNNPHIKTNIDQYLRQGLISYYKTTLTPVNINIGKKVYFSNKRAIEMSQEGLGGIALKSLQS